MLVLFQNSGECTKNNPVFVEALEIVHRAEPSAFTAFLMGNLLIQKSNKTEQDYINYRKLFHRINFSYMKRMKIKQKLILC
jgi:hypothetical protein